MFLAVLAAALVVWVLLPSNRQLPPGPRAYPLLGNLLSMPDGKRQWEELRTWSKRWGNLTSATVFGKRFVFIHSYELALEIFEKNGNIFSDRPRLQMMRMMGWEVTPMLMQPGASFKESRKMMYTEFGTNSVVHKLSIYEEESAKRLVKMLISSPDEFYKHVELHVGSVALKVAYGYDTQPKDDPMIHLALKAMVSSARATTPGAFLVELIPPMRFIPEWFPFAYFKRQAEIWKGDYLALVNTPFNDAKRKFEKGALVDCFISRWLQMDLADSQVDNLRHTAGSIFLGAIETTASTLHTFFFMMQEYPDVQMKAQTEIDSVVGQQRLPVLSDRENLPYITALCKELLRYHPPTPGGVPHSASEDSIQGGYFIPKGAILSPNVWEMTRDSATYPDPEKFDPSRFLSNTPQRDPMKLVFGFGRRACPGILLADSTIFVTVATILAVFKISKTSPQPFVRDAGTISRVMEFKAKVEPRLNETDITALLQ